MARNKELLKKEYKYIQDLYDKVKIKVIGDNKNSKYKDVHFETLRRLQNEENVLKTYRVLNYIIYREYEADHKVKNINQLTIFDCGA